MLSQPLRTIQPATRTASALPPTEELPKTEKEKTLAKARVIFGSRLAGPAERRDEIERKSKYIAGILVPPRPTEPDNCCMSGCVNCVWDIYRDELEDWAAKSAEAGMRLQAQRKGKEGNGIVAAESDKPTHIATSMDDDGGGSETNWEPAISTSSQDLFKDIPVGIREFMKTEKMLKQRHMKEKPSKI
jgi:hypothetical protein